MTIDIYNTSETDILEFKSEFDVKSNQSWIELIKDIVAMGNTNGGIILIGVNNDGTPCAFSSEELVNIDVADIVNKVFKYTTRRMTGIELAIVDRMGSKTFQIKIFRQEIPMIFTSPGTYEIIDKNGKVHQKTAWSIGSIYFRHSGSSDPGSTEDLSRWVHNLLKEFRGNLLAGISKVVESPMGSVVKIIPNDVVITKNESVFSIRITDDPNAHSYTVVDIDKLYPYRQIELIRALAAKGVCINQYHIHIARVERKADENLQFSHKTNHGTRQYSEMFLQVLLDAYSQDSDFFVKLVQKHHK